MNPWFITLITICGFPKYACGHTHILLTGGKDNHCILIHLRISREEKFPPAKYWAYYFATKRLNSIIEYSEDRNEIRKILEHCSSSLISSCTMWKIDDNNAGQKIYDNLTAKPSGEKFGSFFVYGKQIGRFLGSPIGSNCMDFSKNLLKREYMARKELL